MSKKVNWIMTEDNITVDYDGETHIISRSDGLADILIKALKEKRIDEIPNLVSVAKRVETFSKGNFTVENGEVLINGIKTPPVLSRKILDFSKEGLPYEPLLKFAENLQKNPSFRAVNELYQFLEKNNHPITENGNFIAYKKVREDFLDVHTGTMDNSPGKVVEMPRNEVNEDPNQTCSEGLHAANFSYSNKFYAGGVMLKLEINPRDVVSIPIDYNQAKMRVCKYKVLEVITQPHSDKTQLVSTATEELNDSLEEEWFCESCGDPTEEGYDVCEECEEEEREERDQYPWEEELDE